MRLGGLDRAERAKLFYLYIVGPRRLKPTGRASARLVNRGFIQPTGYDGLWEITDKGRRFIRELVVDGNVQ